MLEVTYNSKTKKLTAWNGDPKQFRNKTRKGHKVLILDRGVPRENICDLRFNESRQELELDE